MEMTRNDNNSIQKEGQRREWADIQAAVERIQASEANLDKIRGCLFGGAVGDALGYPVEFMGEKMIFSQFGAGGIRQYVLDQKSGKALISDDTQMTLFTANGLLVGETRGKLKGIGGCPWMYVAMAYQDWLRTQEISFADSHDVFSGYKGNGVSWLCDVPELYACRAPGNTCLSALEQQRKNGPITKDPIEAPQNDSKGCGGIMRVAPVALRHIQDIRELDMEGARIAAVTHGHSLGYMPAAVLTHILDRIVFLKGEEQSQTLREIVIEARDTIAELFREDAHLEELTDIIDLALRLSENDRGDLENIHQLGEGWVAEETLGIALYCSLRYPDDFSAGVIASVNHSGDSDSTGAVTGNILGALCGYGKIEEKWKKDLEMADVILEMADDLCYGCQMSEYGTYRDPVWLRKYVEMKWKDKEPDPYRPRAGRWKRT